MNQRIYLSPPDVSEAERRNLLDAFDSNWISPLGPHVDAFEREFASLVQTPAAVALSSGTAALHLAMKALGVKQGDTVLVPTLTFAATANPVTYLGAKPAFIDVSADTWTLDPALLAEELAARAKRGKLPAALITVDLYGQCCDYDRIVSICEQYKVPLIADAAEAVGATYKSKPAGSFGLCAAFSFNSNKIITTGGGGMLVSHDRAFVERVRYLSTQARDPVPHYQHAEVGFNYRMSNLLAAIGRGQLANLGQKLERRRQINTRYREALEHRDGITFMPEAKYGRSNLWLTCIVIDPAAAGVSREDLRKHLESLSIETRPVWKPMHLQPAFSDCENRGGDVSEYLFEHGLCLPSGSSLTATQQERVIEAITEVFERRWFASPAVADADTASDAEMSVAAPVSAKPIPASRRQPAGAARSQPRWLARVKRGVLRSHRSLAIGSQMFLMAACNYLALLLRFDGAPAPWAMEGFWYALPWLVAIRALTFLPLGLYQGLWRYTSLNDVERLIGGIGVSSLIFAGFVLSPLGPPQGYARAILFIDPLLLTLSLSGLRMSRRLYVDLRKSRRRGKGRRVLIYGAGSAGEMVAREMRMDLGLGYDPVGFVDDDLDKVGRRIHGIPVLGTGKQLAAFVEKHKPTEVLVAIPSADAATINRIVRSVEAFRVPIKTLPHLKNIISGREVTSQVRHLAIEDLIPRLPANLNVDGLRRFIEGRSVVVTGAGGSIGAELCRQLVRLRPFRLTLIDRHQASLQDTLLQLRDRRTPTELVAVLADITDADAVNAAFAKAVPALIFHAAGHAHGVLVEDNPGEAIHNNVDGTRVVAEAALRIAADRMVLISPIMAANPEGVLAVSKQMAEQAMLEKSGTGRTIFSVVRVGNVLGTAGSLLPRFITQIQNGGPVTISHPDAQRYFVRLADAAQLILHASVQTADGGVYALDMGDPVRVVDIATNLIRLAGLTPYTDVAVEFSGLRPGEKIREDICGQGERLVASSIPRVWLVSSGKIPGADVDSEVARIVSQNEIQGSENEMAADRSEAQSCPKCRAQSAYRSRSRGVVEPVMKQWTSKRVFRCDKCGWRGWLDPVETSQSAPMDKSAAPDLAALDDLLK